MRCPKCGYQRQPKDDAFVLPTECPACGVVYAKYESERLAGRIPQLLRKPSPLDEATLKQARERVEQRLRKKMLTQAKSEEKARTLERARKIFLEELRRRWEQEADREKSAIQNSDTIEESGSESRSERLPAAMAALAESSDNALRATVRKEKLDQENSLPNEHPAGKQAEEIEEISDSDIASCRQGPKATKDTFQQHDQASGLETGSLELHFRSETPRWLPIAGIVTLIAGIAGALISWVALEPAQAGTLATGTQDGQGLPLEMIIGFCYLAVGILGSALFWIIFLMTRQLNQMRNILAALIGQEIKNP